jgi:hypothetical protein
MYVCMYVRWEEFIHLKRKVNVLCRPRQRGTDRHLLKRQALTRTNGILMLAAVFKYSRL